MNILSLIVFGLVVGVIAKFLMPGRDPGGFIVTILIGIAGSFVGGYIGPILWPMLGLHRPDKGAGWMMSILGAIILLALYRLLIARRSAY